MLEDVGGLLQSLLGDRPALDGAVLGAVVTGALALFARWREGINDRKRLREVLIGELRALRSHYLTTAETFSRQLPADRVESHLKMAAADEPHALDSENLVRAGMPKSLIPALIQLQRTIRNNNLECDIAYSRAQHITEPMEHQYLRDRMRRTSEFISMLLKQLGAHARTLVAISLAVWNGPGGADRA